MENIENILPLSPMQRDILLRHLGAPGLEEYTEQVCWTIRGAYRPGVFARAWEQTVARHPTLRTAFFWEGLDRPLQVVHGQAELPTERLDWRGVPREELDGRMEALLAADRRLGFRIDAAPLMRLTEVRVADDEFRFVWSHHHLLLDGWSATVCIREVFGTYEALCRDEAPRPGPVRPYAAYLAWLEGRDSAGDERFWHGALAELDDPAPLGIARAAGGARGGERYAVHTTVFPAELVERLRGAGRRGQLTLNTLLQGAWALLLGHYGGARDVVFGGITSGRPVELPGAESILGVCVAEVPVRVRIDPDAPLGEWLAGLQAAQAEARAHEYCSLAEIQEWSGAAPGGRLFDTLLVFQNLPDAQLGAAEVAGQEVADFRRVPTGGGLGHALLLEVVPRRDGLVLNLTRDLDRVDAGAAGRVLEHLRTLLEAMAADPARPVGELSPLSVAERARVLAAGRAEREYPADGCIHERFAARAARAPDTVAVTYEGESLTYAELDRRSDRLARVLRARGVGSEARVGVCAERSAELVVALLGVLKAGAAYVPLDPAYPAERLAYVLEDAGIGVALAQERTRDRLPAAGVEVVSLDREEDAPAGPPAMAVRPEGLAYVIYTSGSTGRPKGVMVE
ncbi:MAG: AMP-binding protein, partial [Gemmatimonadetes bacterium]|nr:AMP-binding protein [Gemmatimonadota bacterium]